MSKVDWSLAPEGATHWDASDSRVNSFMKLEGDMWFYWPPASDDPEWNRWGKAGRQDVSEMIERPKPNQWSGPKDGLPPVGTACEYSLGDSNCWYACDIKYVLRNGDGLVAECHLKPSIEQYLNTYQGTECFAKFRQLKTPEQLAADQRETAIREIMDIADVDCRVTAAKLVDAGFKREVV